MKLIYFALSFLFVCLALASINAQNYQVVDDFENGLSGWEYYYTVYPDYQGYELNDGDNIIGLDEFNCFDDYSFRLDPVNEMSGAIRCINTNDKYDYGIYTAWLYMEPNNSQQMSTDALFYFQYKDENTFYFVTIYPADSDNPGIKLRKKTHGNVEVLASAQPLTYFNHWYELIIERYSTGQIIISVYNPETEETIVAIDYFDHDIQKEGYVGVGCFSNAVLWDDIGYDNMENVTNLRNKASCFFNVFPNPASDVLCFVPEIDGVDELCIMSIDGKILKHLKSDNNEINISDMSEGIYLLRVRTRNKVFLAKFQISR